jgi:hypothetical protein
MAENEDIMIEEPKGEEAIQALAQEMGWKDEDEYDGDPETFVDAKTFIKRGGDIQKSMQQHIRDQKKQLADLRAGLEDLRQHNERVYKTEVKKLKTQITDLTTKRREAIEEGDPDRVEEIDKELEDMKSVVSETEQLASGSKKPEASDNPEFDQWKTQNTWYGTDKEMTAYADTQADGNVALKGLPYTTWLQKIETLVKEQFPEKFESGNGKRRTDPVESGHGRTRGKAKGKYTRADLSQDHREIMDRFVRTGALTEEQYIADLVEMGELK